MLCSHLSFERLSHHKIPINGETMLVHLACINVTDRILGHITFHDGEVVGLSCDQGVLNCLHACYGFTPKGGYFSCIM